MNSQQKVIQAKRAVKKLKRVPLVTACSSIYEYRQAVNSLLQTVILLGEALDSQGVLKTGEDSSAPMSMKDAESSARTTRLI